MKVIKHKDRWYLQSDTGYKEILLSTDTDLINDGVQAIEDDFLEWFVKNPSCEFVEVEKSNLLNTSRTYLGVDKHKIIIPHEEPKQETIEEAAERNCISITHPYCDREKEMFFKGANWQAERMYSEEDMKQFAFECVANFLSNNDNKVEIKLVDVIIDRLNFQFKQFKNK
jgi:hypothetical protein